MTPNDTTASRTKPLARRAEAALLRLRRVAPGLQAALFIAFLLLILIPLLLPDPPSDGGSFLHPANLARVAFWDVWFPLALLSVLVAGRLWCGLLCPMGAASEAASRIGLRRPPPAWLQWRGTPVVAFAAATVLGQTLGVRDHPEAIAELFGGMMALALLTGLLYAPGKRPWCRHACPIGLLLGVYSRLGIVQLAPKRPLPGPDALTVKGVCPTMIALPRKKASRHCLVCMRCVSPAARGGLSLRLRRPGEEIERIRDHTPRASEVWFLFLGGGLALGGFLWIALPEFGRMRLLFAELAVNRGWLWLGEPGPAWLMSVHPERREVFMWLDFFAISGFMAACMAAVAGLLALSSAAAAAIAGRLGGDGSQASRFVEIGYQHAPVAMVSLLLGLGGGAFATLSRLGLPPEPIAGAKAALLTLGVLWSLRLGDRILARQGVGRAVRPLALAPGLLAGSLVALAWSPALIPT